MKGEAPALEGSPGTEPGLALRRLRRFLDTLDVDRALLRRDRAGTTWLPPAVQRLCDVDAECRAELQRYVDEEIELFDSADLGSDAFFTARVLGKLPMPLRWTGLSPSRRVALIVGFHLGGAALGAWLFAWLTPELVAEAWHAAHQWLGPVDGALFSGGNAAPVEWAAWLGLVVAAVAFVGSTSHTSEA